MFINRKTISLVCRMSEELGFQMIRHAVGER